jgi:fructose/tagatose bisphosphate aldolase
MLVNLDYVLKRAQEGGYAVGLFNTTDTDMLEGVLQLQRSFALPLLSVLPRFFFPTASLSSSLPL